MEAARGPCGLEKACQLCCRNRQSSPWDSRLNTLKDRALLPVMSYEVDLMAGMACLYAVHTDGISVSCIACTAPRWQHTFLIHQVHNIQSAYTNQYAIYPVHLSSSKRTRECILSDIRPTLLLRQRFSDASSSSTFPVIKKLLS